MLGLLNPIIVGKSLLVAILFVLYLLQGHGIVHRVALSFSSKNRFFFLGRGIIGYYRVLWGITGYYGV